MRRVSAPSDPFPLLPTVPPSAPSSAIGVRPGVGDDDQRIGLHCDGEYGHPEGEVNFMLTFTPMFGSNGCFVESEPDKGDFAPIVMEYGQVFRFWGNKCVHPRRGPVDLS